MTMPQMPSALGAQHPSTKAKQLMRLTKAELVDSFLRLQAHNIGLNDAGIEMASRFTAALKQIATMRRIERERGEARRLTWWERINGRTEPDVKLCPILHALEHPRQPYRAKPGGMSDAVRKAQSAPPPLDKAEEDA